MMPQHQGLLVVALANGGSRFLATFRGTKERFRDKVSAGGLVALHNAVEISSTLIPVQKRSPINTPGLPQTMMAFSHKGATHMVDLSVVPIPTLRLLVFGYYLVDDLPAVARARFVDDARELLQKGKQNVKELSKESPAPSALH